jgi:DNA-binding transcriptional regulator YiaG
MRGYSQIIVEANVQAKETIGTILGAMCISLKYPVSQVAKKLNVSRQTVYDWFSGRKKPAVRHQLKIKELIVALDKK